jgi:putative ferrous iron transport protein C
MILTELQGHVRSRERVSLAQLSASFGIQPDALRGMLDRLVAKGRIRRLQSPGRCSGCTLCPPEALEFYEWAAASPASPPPRCAMPEQQRRGCPHCG